ncbi:MAG: hypothetical protein JST92_16385 [Deltaproteobacteria bacterium]|nr:hypothetical protein [Deltaproteobacteria bacterium]
MRRVALLLALLLTSCADWQRRPTFPESATGLPVLQEQAILGVSERGACVAQLILADGAPAELTLLVFESPRGSGTDSLSSRTIDAAPPAVAREVAQRILADGKRLLPLLRRAVASSWPAAIDHAEALGFTQAAETPSEPGRRRWALPGANGVPLSMRSLDLDGATGLALGEAPQGEASGDEVELTRMPLSGEPVSPGVWIQGGTVWLLAGSVRGGTNVEPLHRTVGVRRASLLRGEAELHNLHGLADYSTGELDAARREFDRALTADDAFVDALYNAASVAALTDRMDDALSLLKRAAVADPKRVQVLGRDDDDLRVLRKRPDVRALLGLVRMPPGE